MLMILAVAATALAAHPKKGAKFKGTLLDVRSGTITQPVKWGKFRAPVSFKVSSSATDLLDFKYGYTGCFGFGGVPITTDVYTHYGSIKRVGTIRVSASGSFKVAGSKSIHKTSGHGFSSTVTTTTSVTGKFTSSRKASGTISFTQRDVYNGKASKCGPVSVTFSARAG